MRFKKIKIITSLLVLFLLVLLGFKVIPFSSKVIPSIDNNPNEAPQMLIVFTNTKNQVNYIVHKNNEDTNLYRNQLTGYPTGLLYGNTLFFSNADSTGQSQLYSIDLKTKVKKQLTSQFQTVDFLRMDGVNKKVYMRVALKGKRNFHIATYNLMNEKIEIWNSEDEDNSVKYFDISAYGQIIAVMYSINEDYKNVTDANTNGVPFKPSKHNILLLDESGKVIKVVNSLYFDISDISISPKGDKALFTVTEIDQSKITSSDYDKTIKKKLYNLDVNSGSYNLILSDNDKFYKVQQANYSVDDQGIYFIATPSNSKLLTAVNGEEAKQKSIYYFDLGSRKITEFWKKDGVIINNYLIKKTVE